MPRPLIPGTQELFSACCAVAPFPDESMRKCDVAEQSSKRQNPDGPPTTPPSTPKLPPTPAVPVPVVMVELVDPPVVVPNDPPLPVGLASTGGGTPASTEPPPVPPPSESRAWDVEAIVSRVPIVTLVSG